MKINVKPVVDFMMKNNLSIHTFSMFSGIHRHTIMNVLENKNVQFKTLCKFAKFLKIDPLLLVSYE